MKDKNACPRCEKRGLKTWDQLSDDELEVVKRLPGAAVYSESDRKATHRWCTRCWFEETMDQERHA